MFSNALIPIFCTEEIRQMPKDFSGAPGDAKVPPLPCDRPGGSEMSISRFFFNHIILA